jgi:tetratricopeptide (TPR) repeat protein
MSPVHMFAALGIFTAFAVTIPVSYLFSCFMHFFSITEESRLPLLALSRHLESEPAESSRQAAALTQRGLAYTHLGQPQRALGIYTHALALAPGDARLYLRRGEACCLLGQYTQALSDYEQALRLDPELAAAHYGRGQACQHLGAYEEALESYTQALALDPQLAPLVYAARAGLYQHLHDYRAALADYCHALDYAPHDVGLYFQRGITYLHLREPRLARADFNVVLRMRPNFACAYHHRAEAYLHLHDLAQARRDCQQASVLNPLHIDHGWLACWVEMCYEPPDLQMASRLEATARIDQGTYDACLCRGVAAWLHGECTLALGELAQAEAQNSERWGAPFWRAVVSVSLQRSEEGHAAIREALRRGLPLPLLAPLRWLSGVGADFYGLYAHALLEA